MRTSSKQSPLSSESPELAVIYTDDGGSGMLEACKTRFASPKYEVECDDRHTVWVKHAEGTRSFGLPPWLLRLHPMNEVLAGVETKLALSVAEN